ncbi:MAG: LacI family DNA-binding transcriptional regulator [Saprospiraceae bacterium]|nr:LacI family DNA-binding transcriptional regulator [Saprospiraceae bacterium]
MEDSSSLGIKDIAKIANVSIGTVDRVLHNRDGVSPTTRKRILQIIEETGYTKNIMASRLKLAARKKIKIAILIPEIKSELSYWRLPQKGIEKAVTELKEQGISIQYFQFNFLHPQSFNEQCGIILSENYDGIITVPLLEKESNELLAIAQKAGIPVVFLDTERSLDHEANFICQNSYKAGKVAGRLLHGLVGSKGKYFVVNILNEDGIQINNLQRENGFRSFFEENFKDQKIEIHTVNHPLKDDFEMTDELKDLFTSNTTKGIFVTNARSFLIPGILKENKITDTFIIGFDLNRKNLALLKKGQINFLINQKPEFQGYSAIKSLFKFLTKKDDSELNIDIPVEIIVKENA